MNTELVLTMILRLGVAGMLGTLIGLEREYRAKEAGMRTHFLVALGSALIMIVSQYGFGGKTADASRVAAQIVSGIGFIGAGAILQSKGRIRGLTTAASLWVAAAIGLAVGSGLYLTSIAGTLLTLITLHWFSSLEIKADKIMAKRTICFSEEECEALADEIGAENVMYLEQTRVEAEDASEASMKNEKVDFS